MHVCVWVQLVAERDNCDDHSLLDLNPQFNIWNISYITLQKEILLLLLVILYLFTFNLQYEHKLFSLKKTRLIAVFLILV